MEWGTEDPMLVASAGAAVVAALGEVWGFVINVLLVEK